MGIIEDFSKVKVLVVGDVMLDRYWWGSVSRISPEAPVPIVDLTSTSLAIGGAANVAANVAGLGAEVFLIGLVGVDQEAEDLRNLLAKINIAPDFLVSSENRPTTLKTRVVAHNQQMLRVDQERREDISEKEEAAVWHKIQNCLERVEIVIASDYAKGLLTENLLSRLITTCNSKNIFLLVDPKGANFTKYKNAAILTPNRKEAMAALGLSGAESTSLELIGNQLMAHLSLQGLLITLGEDGIALFRDKKETLYLKALARHVYDVTGAGDTVIAALAVALGAGIKLPEAARIANAAAGFVVEEVGTTIIEIDKLNKYLKDLG